MQTRRFGFRALTLAFASVLTLGLAACEETGSVTPPQPTVLTISPSGNVPLFVGDRIQVVANLTNPGTNATITFASSNPAVATVDQQGTVTAVAPGIATITATATGNAGETIRQAMTVSVSTREPVGPQPRVFITGFTTPAGDAVTNDSIAGTILVRLEVEPGNADSLQVMIGNRRACFFNFSTAAALITADGQEISAAQIPLSCTVNTATLGVQNGPTNITARLFRGTTVVASNQQPVTLRNVSTINTSIAASRNAINPRTGLVWHDGAVTVNATPAIFGGAQIARVTVQLVARGGATVGTARTDSTAENGAFSVTFAEDAAPLEGLLTDSLYARISATTTAGEQFQFPQAGGTTTPNITTAGIRYDDAAPTVTGTITSRQFVGNISAAAIASGTSARDTAAPSIGNPPAGETEVTGVNAVTFEVFALQTTSTSVSADSIFRAGTRINSGNQLTAGQTYRFAVRACDALGNCTGALSGAPFTARVDLTPPEILDLGEIEDDSIFAFDLMAFNPSVTDDVAGFGASPLRVVAIQTDTASATPACYIGDEASNPAADADDDCEPVAVGLSVPVGNNAYFTYTIQAVDQAGNVSAARTVTILEDQIAPSATSVSFPVTLSGGSSFTATGRVRDNLDLDQYDAGLVYGGAIGYLPFITPVDVDNTFGTPLTTSVNASQSFVYVNGVLVQGQTVGQHQLAAQVAFQGVDKAGNVGLGGTAIPTPGAFDGISGTVNFALSFSGTGNTLCIDGSCDPEPTTRVATARVVVTSETTTQPFDRVFFYARYTNELGQLVTRLIGVDETGAGSVTATERRYDFTTTINGSMFAELGAGQSIRFFAVGVDSDGDGLATDLFATTLVTADE